MHPLTQRANFRIQGIFPFLVPPRSTGRFDVRFSAPDRVSSRWVTKPQDVTKGPLTYEMHAGGAHLQCIISISSLLLPRDEWRHLFSGRRRYQARGAV
jgi:hypothetical protein